MTDETGTDTVDTPDESNDSPVISELRKTIRDLEKQVKSAPSRESIEAELREVLARESAIAGHLGDLGHPAGMAATVNGWLGDAEATREGVVEALRGKGYEVDVASASSDSAGSETGQDTTQLANVSDLSTRVGAAAQGDSRVDPIQQINEAKTPEELAAVAKRLGFLEQSY